MNISRVLGPWKPATPSFFKAIFIALISFVCCSLFRNCSNCFVFILVYLHMINACVNFIPQQRYAFFLAYFLEINIASGTPGRGIPISAC